MKTYWRIYHYINSTLRAWNRKTYLEIGAGDGLNVRRVEAREKVSVSEGKLPKEWTGYHYEMKTEDFLNLIAPDQKGRFGVVMLRDWNSQNLEERVKRLYPLLMPDGVLIVSGFDPTGEKNDAWRLAVGLRNEGYPYGVLKGRFLLVYKVEEELVGRLRSRMSLGSYLKQVKKFINEGTSE